jgi:hypothetical protein
MPAQEDAPERTSSPHRCSGGCCSRISPLSHHAHSLRSSPAQIPNCIIHVRGRLRSMGLTPPSGHPEGGRRACSSGTPLVGEGKSRSAEAM